MFTKSKAYKESRFLSHAIKTPFIITKKVCVLFCAKKNL